MVQPSSFPLRMDFTSATLPIRDFLSQPLLAFILQAAVGYLAVLWIVCILWVVKDASNRSESILFQLIAILLVVLATPLIGLPLYLLLRPSQTLAERDTLEMLQELCGYGEEEEEEDPETAAAEEEDE